jgi:hypothetical protein
MVYAERPGPVNGYANNRDPDVNVAFDAGDRIAGAFGLAYDVSNWQGLGYLGFWMSSGKQYGPYGTGQTGNAFSLLATIRGVFGTAWDSNQLITGIGFWVNAPSPPPAPPARSPPPVASPPPRSLYNWGRVRSISSGYVGNVKWDDGPYYSGAGSPGPAPVADPGVAFVSFCKYGVFIDGNLAPGQSISLSHRFKDLEEW